MKFTFTFILTVVLTTGALPAQEINFSKYDNYSITLTKLSDLDFGYIIANSGLQEINLNSPDISTITIQGVKYLDVTIELDAGTELLLNGNSAFAGDASKAIPFTLEAAYANNGQDNTSEAKLININSANYGSVRLPIKQRETIPPGPPPTPPHENYIPPTETAYLYIYGYINVGQVDAGSYFNSLTVTITYN